MNQINKAGGINGRKINPIISYFTPTNENVMRSLCKSWTEGSPAAFAVLDGVGTWSGDNELCVTQEGHTPFIGQWTTVTNWTTQGSPYLWWTGPDDAAILQAVVNWGLATGLIGPSKKLGIVAGDRASDKLALNDYLLPDLRRRRGEAGGRVDPVPARQRPPPPGPTPPWSSRSSSRRGSPR